MCKYRRPHALKQATTKKAPAGIRQGLLYVSGQAELIVILSFENSHDHGIRMGIFEYKNNPDMVTASKGTLAGLNLMPSSQANLIRRH